MEGKTPPHKLPLNGLTIVLSCLGHACSLLPNESQRNENMQKKGQFIYYCTLYITLVNQTQILPLFHQTKFGIIQA